MNKHTRLIFHLALAALLAGLASPASAEWKQMKVAQGNNLGIVISVDKNTPLYAGYYSVSEYSWQVPRGSGNMIGGGGLSYSPSGLVDLNGDGATEDTIVPWGRGAMATGGVGSLEARDLITQLAGSGEIMHDAVNRIENNRVWSSLDADDLADWPVEFREGRSSGGAPVVYGSETMVTRFTDAFQIAYGMPLGASVEYSFYFLNYAESNDMMYGKCFVRNMSEYVKYNFEPLIADKAKAYAPDGYTWKEMTMSWSAYEMAFPPGEDGDERFGFHPAREAVAIFDMSGLESSFTPQETPIFVEKVLRPMSHNGETMTFRSFHPKLYNTYGMRNSVDVFENGRTNYQAYAWQLGEIELPANTINLWTGKQAIAGLPGAIKPGDNRYDQWLYGFSYNLYASYAVLHDFAPRDSASLDFVFAFVPVPKGESVQMPLLNVDEMDNPEFQAYLGRCDKYLDVAAVVHSGNYVLPETPQPPQLTIVPGDRQVTITWSDVNIDQTDAYYYFVQQHPELDPDGLYREKDFEGYRLYRSFIGPTNSNVEVIDSCSISMSNLHFFFVDRMIDDIGKERMTNGMKVWYALVPYDRNYNLATGEEMSLPSRNSGKVWNRPGSGLYSVIPRTDASDYRQAYLDQNAGFTFTSHASTPVVAGTTAILTGDGSGKLTQAPVNLAPPLVLSETKIVPVVDERIKHDITFDIVASSWGWEVARDFCGDGEWLRGTVMFSAILNGRTGVEGGPLKAFSDSKQTISLAGPPDDEGVLFGVEATFENLDVLGNPANLIGYIEAGSYTGATLSMMYGGNSCRPIGGPPGAVNFIRNGKIHITWADAGNGELTVTAVDETYGDVIPYAEYPDDNFGRGWGFWTIEGYGAGQLPPPKYNNGMYIDEWLEAVPRAEREVKQSRTMPADNLENFAIFINGQPWVITDIMSMPTPGTEWVVTYAFGEWNEAQTEFTQYPDLPIPGDKWTLTAKPPTMNPEDADLSKVKVVPNPYLASAYFDLSPSSRRIEFINLPSRCTISIYTLSGNLVNVLNHIGTDRNGWGNYQDWDRLDANSQPRQFTGYDNHSGTEPWNLRNRFGQTVASGLYFYHVTDSRGKSFTGKFYVVN